jgi:hypothetical protein
MKNVIKFTVSLLKERNEKTGTDGKRNGSKNVPSLASGRRKA